MFKNGPAELPVMKSLAQREPVLLQEGVGRVLLFLV